MLCCDGWMESTGTATVEREDSPPSCEEGAE